MAIRVLVIDDSALMRQMLTQLLSAADDIEVVACAEDPFQARELIKQLSPDVLTLDVEMPGMNGLSFLKNLMRLHPLPVIMVSTLTAAGAPVTLEALELGAVDFTPKPSEHGSAALQLWGESLQEKVRIAAKARLRVPRAHGQAQVVSRQARASDVGKIVAIGASTGGTEAIKEVIEALPAACPPIVIAQHIPAQFSTSFAKRLDLGSALTVHEAQNNQLLQAGHVYLAPGDWHLSVVASTKGPMCQLQQSEAVNRHRPSVDVLFDSLSADYAKRCLAVLLTGMGRDGAQGLRNLLDAGANTIAQDQDTSVVWGMPGAAVELGAAQRVLPLGKVAQAIVQWADKS